MKLLKKQNYENESFLKNTAMTILGLFSLAAVSACIKMMIEGTLSPLLSVFSVVILMFTSVFFCKKIIDRVFSISYKAAKEGCGLKLYVISSSLLTVWLILKINFGILLNESSTVDYYIIMYTVSLLLLVFLARIVKIEIVK